MAGQGTDDLFGGDFYVESDDVTRGVQLGGTGFAPPAFPPGKGKLDDPFGSFEKEGFVSSFGDVDFIGAGPRLSFGHESVTVPKRPLEGRSYLCASEAAPAMLEALEDFFATHDAVVKRKAQKCGLGVQMVAKYKELRLKVLLSRCEAEVGVSFVRKRGDAVDFAATTAEAAAHMQSRSGRDLRLAGSQQRAELPPPLALPAGLQPPMGFLAPPPMGFAAPPPLPAYSVTEDDMAPLLAMLEDGDAEAPQLLLGLLDTEPQLLPALAPRADQCLALLASAPLAACAPLLQRLAGPSGPRADLAAACAQEAAARFPREDTLGRRQLARLLHGLAPGLTELPPVAPEAGVDVKTERYLAEAALLVGA